MKTPEKDRNWKRRIVTTFFWFGSLLFFTAILPIVVPFSATYDLLRRSNFSTTRTFVYFAWFFYAECGGLVGAFLLWLAMFIRRDPAWYELRNRQLQRRWGRALFWGAERIFDIAVNIEGLEALENERPALVLSRHASSLDTMFPIAIVRELKEFRYVMKAELLHDPAIDFVAQRIPNAFVRRGAGDPVREIEKLLQLGRDLGPNAAVVVYPEGTRFSERKRERLIEKFEASHDERLLSICNRLQRTLPPLREGGVRMIEEMQDADVVFLSHRGIDRASSLGALFDGCLTGAELDIAIWRVPADRVPREREAIEAFLVEQWEEVDRFACGHPADLTQTRPTGSGRARACVAVGSEPQRREA